MFEKYVKTTDHFGATNVLNEDNFSGTDSVNPVNQLFTHISLYNG